MVITVAGGTGAGAVSVTALGRKVQIADLSPPQCGAFPMALDFQEDPRFDTPGFTVLKASGETTSVGYFESPNEIVLTA